MHPKPLTDERDFFTSFQRTLTAVAGTDTRMQYHLYEHIRGRIAAGALPTHMKPYAVKRLINQYAVVSGETVGQYELVYTLPSHGVQNRALVCTYYNNHLLG